MKGTPRILTIIGAIILALMALAIVCMVFGCSAHAQYRDVYVYDGTTVSFGLPEQPKRDTRGLYVLASVAFVTANLADWQLQTEQHGWQGCLWEPNSRGERWPWYADWIPHDGYHAAQSIHTGGMLIGSGSIAYIGGQWWKRALEIVIFYSVSRLFAFSLPRYLSQRY